MDDFQEARGLGIGDKRAVIEQVFDDASRIAKQGVAQPRFEALDGVGYPFLRDRFAEHRDEGLGFAVSFPEALRLEFFKAVMSVAAVVPWAARWARPCSMARKTPHRSSF